MSVAKFKLLLLGESRLRGLDAGLKSGLEMYNMFDIELECLYFPGANVHETVSRGLRNGKYHYYDVIYLMTGINELSIRGKNRLVCPRFIDDKDIMAHMQDIYRLIIGC